MKTHNVRHMHALLVLAAALATPVKGQTNEAITRVAIITETGKFSTVADLLTVELSAKPHLVVLERAQIEKVYREQGLSAVNRDYVKLGQVLGAEGLLFLGTTAEGTNTFVSARLVAVKPGVVIGNVRAPWPVPDTAGWARWLANHFTPVLPKLDVSAKDAIPISVVNLRSAFNAKESRETEHLITRLVTERLSRERELFVLERQKMELLTAEKALKGMEESAFWNGSFLLDGVIDRDGYSKERVTLHARLTPPAGGSPVELSVAGPRANPAAAVEELTTKLLQVLKREPSIPAWKLEAEAQKFFEEARWALKWGVFPQAQAASESAWALGKQDLDCALVRVKSYLPDVPPRPDVLKTQTHFATRRRRDATVKELTAKHPLGLVWNERVTGDQLEISYLYVNAPPDAQSLDRALHLLELYSEFTRTLLTNEPPAGSPWYRAGIEALEACSRVLSYFHILSENLRDQPEKLAELRALAREVAERLAQPPSVHDGYWIANRRASHDELAHTMAEDPHIFRAQLLWSACWQERPEDVIAVYRSLLSSPVFCYFHQGFWLRDLSQPRLAAWTRADRERIPALWQSFLSELNTSTNFLWRMEAKALGVAEPASDEAMEQSFEELFAIVASNRAAIATNNIELAYLQWGLGALVNRSGVVSETREKLRRSEHFRELDALANEWWNPARASSPAKATVASVPTRKETSKLDPPPSQQRELVATNVLEVSRYFSIPLERFQENQPRESFSEVGVMAHRVVGNRLWLDVRFKHIYIEYFSNGSRWVNRRRGTTAFWKPEDSSWELVPYPPAEVPPNRVPIEYATLGGDALYVSGWEYLRRYDASAGRWETLPVPWQEPARLFDIKGRLFAANDVAVFEIREAGRDISILASCRRRPALSALDALESLGSPCVFAGPENSPRVLAAGKIFGWNGRDWIETMSGGMRLIEDFDDVALFSQSGRFLLLPHAQTNAIVGWVEEAGPRGRPASPLGPAVNSSKPRWQPPVGLPLAKATTLVSGSSLVFFVEHCGETNLDGKRQVIEKDGRHADLICFDPELTTPLVVPLRFDLRQGTMPESGLDRGNVFEFTAPNRGWMRSVETGLLVGRGTLGGFWLIPQADWSNARANRRGPPVVPSANTPTAKR